MMNNMTLRTITIFLIVIMISSCSALKSDNTSTYPNAKGQKKYKHSSKKLEMPGGIKTVTLLPIEISISFNYSKEDLVDEDAISTQFTAQTQASLRSKGYIVNVATEEQIQQIIKHYEKDYISDFKKFYSVGYFARNKANLFSYPTSPKSVGDDNKSSHKLGAIRAISMLKRYYKADALMLIDYRTPNISKAYHASLGLDDFLSRGFGLSKNKNLYEMEGISAAMIDANTSEMVWIDHTSYRKTIPALFQYLPGSLN